LTDFFIAITGEVYSFREINPLLQSSSSRESSCRKASRKIYDGRNHSQE